MYETQNGSAKSNMADPVTAAKETVQELAEPLKEKAIEVAKEQKDFGADHLRLLARAMQSASDAIQTDVPQVANYIRNLSNKLDQTSSDIRDSDLEQLGQTMSDFAKRNPALVFGGALLAGLALTRFLKSSKSNPSMPQPNVRSDSSSEMYTGSMPAGSTSNSVYSSGWSSTSVS